ncbi:methyltransferase domain-containing protein [Salinicola endophyticus]|uniref:Methyltransferase domain-containing protein n=1 Tax=Salinicola endophyticus TaxID=1949083 RepID=A0ABY8FJ71_9GAMM|nr:methyltransferase domain-containing protein [Salinicola endophyticus]WFF42853.1 methyltransferase domain-containing protein [Salinicola endophyticus]
MSITSTQQRLADAVRRGRQFWDSGPGAALWRAERACLGPHCEHRHGVLSLQLGMAPLISDMSPIRHTLEWAPSAALARQSNTLVCAPERLPLADDSLDLTVVHHLLEAVERPHQVLQEAARVTRADGRLVVFGWHPYAPAGGAPRRHQPPWQQPWRTPRRLRDWLEFVDFEIERVDYCGFRLPWRSARNRCLETFGRRYNVPLGQAYLLIARRRALPVQPITLREPKLVGAKSGAWLGLARHHPQAPTRDVASAGDPPSAWPLQEAATRRVESSRSA